MARNITARSADYSQWYLDVIRAAELADHSPVRGCMVIRPNGYALWEAIQRDLDRRFKETGHVNAYFPLFIPQSFLAKEAKHVEGFALECAVVTHSGLEKAEDGGLQPKGKLEENLVVRPTSETIIGAMYAQWIKSWRDLPVLINQWANVVRWEMRTRLFLRTTEFLWQEGHTAHETYEDAEEETLRILEIYRNFAEDVLAMPVLKGRKTEFERFAGADTTYCIEAMMQDGKACQAGTSHNLGQNFARAFNVQYSDRNNQLQHVWTTSWGVSTRLIGAMIMTHSDDEGLVVPPRLAPVVAAVIPIYSDDAARAKVLEFADRLIEQLCGEDELHAARKRRGPNGLLHAFFNRETMQRIALDARPELRPGEKHYQAEQRGVPYRIEIGPRDVAAGQIVIKSRLGTKEAIPLAGFRAGDLQARLDAFQAELFTRSRRRMEEHTHRAETYEELKANLANESGFVSCFFTPDREAEARIKADTKATIRLILPTEAMSAPRGRCIRTGEETSTEVVFAVAY